MGDILHHIPPPAVRDWWKRSSIDPFDVALTHQRWALEAMPSPVVMAAPPVKKQKPVRPTLDERRAAFTARYEAIWLSRETGVTVAVIAREYSITPYRVRQIVARIDRREARRQDISRRRRGRSRPVDMGGPRDVWLTFTPGPDPRLDWQVPATTADA